jgi:hypothetical protein
MNIENGLSTAVSTKTTTPPSFLQRTLWTLSLVAIGSVLAIHAALAYSPDLARYVPDLRLASPSPAPACHAVPAAGGCHARPVLIGDFAGCCSMREERPCLTDGLYSEEDDGDTYAELPADAAECLPAESAAPADAADPQASAIEVPPSGGFTLTR